MATRRQRRINELLGEELSMLLQGRVDDPRLAGVAITRVETTQDLSTAKVYFTEAEDTEGTGEDAVGDDVLETLKKVEGLLKTELSGLGLRRVPRLVFARDREYESGERVLRILAGLDVSESPVAGSPGDEGIPSEAEGVGADDDSGLSDAEDSGADDERGLPEDEDVGPDPADG